jgi:hypothetical protein
MKLANWLDDVLHSKNMQKLHQKVVRRRRDRRRPKKGAKGGELLKNA